ncbi:MAG: (d)CMP kinase [Defluviitaleaceae bacterium]|nr:(d)CMP kinase [Defluviitaleaceae bacterium]
MTKTKGFAIAIDGPVGVGKSTTARLVAQKLGMIYIDTGAMYRAVAYYNMKQKIDLTNSTKLAESMKKIHIALTHISGEQRVYLNGEDITNEIRTQEISNNTSVVAAHKTVREHLVAQQEKMAETGKIVMDGRDIGSQVLPWAQVKIYLDAAIETRAARRQADLEAKGQEAIYACILEETKIRDHRDKTRQISPLVQAPDAIYIDNSNLTTEEVAEQIVSHANTALNKI